MPHGGMEDEPLTGHPNCEHWEATASSACVLIHTDAFKAAALAACRLQLSKCSNQSGDSVGVDDSAICRAHKLFYYWLFMNATVLLTSPPQHEQQGNGTCKRQVCAHVHDLQQTACFQGSILFYYIQLAARSRILLYSVLFGRVRSGKSSRVLVFQGSPSLDCKGPNGAHATSRQAQHHSHRIALRRTRPL